ncbi:TlpA disulfide reductase family protein [Hoylesella enoeca]|uniref:Thioredoxin domain-containing protein n=1 Tax=Hoylesella enoeca TaxID=76123 RepID=A0A0S2KKS0_9BACT|nr:TlpA disulfide reductase family protein [Hoylesella enoeca]ALO48896.1 hypothetical protein AS203_07205 [Hoylesella enoeca]
MKTSQTLAAALLIALPAGAQHYTVTGKFPGLKNGAEVALEVKQDGKRIDISTTKVVNGAFRLTGHVAKPTLVQLKINDKAIYGDGEYAQDRGIPILIENTPIVVMAAHFDSIPRNYEYQSTPLFKEKNVTVKGGRAQAQYDEWRKAVYDAELQAWKSEHALQKYQFDTPRAQKDAEQEQRLKNAAKKDAGTVAVLNRTFIEQHPTYVISLKLQRDQLENLFTYTDADYDRMLALLKDNDDQMGYANFRKTIEGLRKFTKGTLYTDFGVVTPKGQKHKLSSFLAKEKYTFIDFWASWCGPCRAAIPKIKALHAQFGTRLRIISISVDAKTEDWKRAMDEEKMPWIQLQAPKSSIQTLRDAYRLTAIPNLLILDPEGHVILATSDPDEAHSMIESLLSDQAGK